MDDDGCVVQTGQWMASGMNGEIERWKARECNKVVLNIFGCCCLALAFISSHLRFLTFLCGVPIYLCPVVLHSLTHLCNRFCCFHPIVLAGSA